MRGLVGEELLTAWERSRELPAQKAALELLALACPERPVGEWPRLSLGERNALLLELQAATLGRRMEGFAVCPECGAQLEFAVDAWELARGLRAQGMEAAGGHAGIAMRPANTLDLLASSEAENEEEARAILLARTAQVCDAAEDREEPAGAADSAARWLAAQPEPAAALLAEQFERVNAAAEIRVQLDCAACGMQTLLEMDIVRFLLREIGAAARRLMAEIHELAGAYGWSEAAIAAMSSVRRSAYLEMLST
ncbi:MAG: hypothetical protein ACRD3N_14635 [Terracidiphilus sp.]